MHQQCLQFLVGHAEAAQLIEQCLELLEQFCPSQCVFVGFFSGKRALAGDGEDDLLCLQLVIGALNGMRSAGVWTMETIRAPLRCLRSSIQNMGGCWGFSLAASVK